MHGPLKLSTKGNLLYFVAIGNTNTNKDTYSLVGTPQGVINVFLASKGEGKSLVFAVAGDDLEASRRLGQHSTKKYALSF